MVDIKERKELSNMILKLYALAIKVKLKTYLYQIDARDIDVD